MSYQDWWARISRPVASHPKWMVMLCILVVFLLWGTAAYSIGSQIGKPFPGFFSSPEHVVSSFTPLEFSGRRAGLQPWDSILAVDGQPWQAMPRLVEQAGAGGTLTYTVQRGNQQLDVTVPVMVFTPEIVLHFLPGYFVSSLVFLAVGIFVYLRKPTEPLNRYLLLYLMVWAIGGSIIWENYLSQNKWLDYLLVPYAVLAPVAGWVFLWNFPADEERKKFLERRPLIQSFIVLAVISIVAMTGLRILADVDDTPALWRAAAVLQGWPYFIMFALSSLVIKSAPLVIILRRSSHRLMRQQAFVMLTGLLLGLMGWYLYIWMPASVHISLVPQTQWCGLISALYPLAIGYAILRYRLLDIRIVVRRGLVYSLLTASLTCVFILLSLLAVYLFRNFTGGQSFFILVLPALLVAFLFQPVRNRIQRFVDRTFFRKEYEVRQTLTRFSHSLSTLRERPEVITLVRNTIIDCLGARDVQVWLPEDGHFTALPGENASGVSLDRTSPLVQTLEGEKRVVYPLSQDESPSAVELHQAGAVLAIPLLTGGVLIGILILAERYSEFPYNEEDIDLLTMLADSTSLALENARLYEERMNLLRDRFFQETVIQEEERRRIARELHDGVGPSLASMNIRLQVVRRQLEREENPTAQEIADLADQAQENIHDVRRLIYDLRPAALDELGLFPALREYITRYQKDHGITVMLEELEDGSRLSPELETALYRMAQEGLANAAKHANAEKVVIHFTRNPTDILMRIQDNGRGFDPNAAQTGNHLGLWSMQNRVEQFGGCFAIQSTPGAGTEISVRIPLRSGYNGGKTGHG